MQLSRFKYFPRIVGAVSLKVFNKTTFLLVSHHGFQVQREGKVPTAGLFLLLSGQKTVIVVVVTMFCFCWP